MTPKRLVLGLLLACWWLTQPCWGQKASNWRVYKMADGLPEPACSSVTLAPHGKVLVKHPNRPFVSELDGYSVTTIYQAEKCNRVWESPAGQLWAASTKGLLEYRNGSWLLRPVPEIGSLNGTNSPKVPEIPLCPVRQGQVLFLLPDALLRFTSDDSPQTRILLRRSQTSIGRFTDLLLARDGGLWIIGSVGLLKAAGSARSLRPDSEWREVIPPPSLQVTNLSGLREYEDGTLSVLSESTVARVKWLASFDGQKWTRQDLGNEAIHSAWRGADKGLWALTSTALYHWESGGTNVGQSEELAARSYYDVAVDPGGGFWLATSEGLFRYASPSWRPPPVLNSLASPIHGLTADNDERLWFVSGNHLHSLRNDVHEEFPLPPAFVPNSRATTAVQALRNGLLLLQSGAQLIVFSPASRTFQSLSNAPGVERRILGKGAEGTVSIGMLHPGVSPPRPSLARFDGAGFDPLLSPPAEICDRGELYAAFTAQNGDLWVGAQHGAAVYREQNWRAFSSSDGSGPESVIGFSELPDGKIWCATFDAIWEYDGNNWVELRRGFERINAILRGRDGSMWIGTDGGLFRFFQRAWVENGVEDGLPAMEVRELYEDQRGRIWAGTTRGLTTYHPEADPDAPETELQELSEAERNIPEGATFNLGFSGVDRWKHTTRDRLLFSYRLDQRDWSEFSDNNHLSLNDLLPGKHYLQVRAMDRSCNIDPTPARLEFMVVLPWYRETRLVLITGVGVLAALFFAALALNRHWRLVRSYAQVEQKVAERTRELERANRELLQSQKMTALGTLAAGIAHDFNNILSIVKGSAQIIEDNLDNPSKVRLRVDRIKTVVDQGAGIVKAMLGFSRDSGDQTGPCDLNAVVQDTVKLLGDRFLREVQVVVEPEPGLPQVPRSRDLIQQVLLNFIFNAAESMATRKDVVVSTHRLERLGADLVLAPEAAEEYVSVSVQDFGCGIPPENLPRVFEPFFTTKALSARRGTGLGLSMVYELAKNMRGGIAVKSVVNGGSTFTLILPVTREIPELPLGGGGRSITIPDAN